MGGASDGISPKEEEDAGRGVSSSKISDDNSLEALASLSDEIGMSSDDNSVDMESLVGAPFITSPFTDDAERHAPFSPTRTLTSGVS